MHLGEGTTRVERFLEREAALDFVFFARDELRARIEAAGFAVTEAIERDPYVGYEYPSRRLSVFATAA